MSDVLNAFIEEARNVDFASYAVHIGRVHVRHTEWTGPCPAHQGTDGYAVNASKGVWNCRKCGQGGHDAISLAAHEHGHDLKSRTGFLEACAEVLGRAVPDPNQRETDEERVARLARMEEARAKAEQRAQDREEEQNAFREKAIRRARGIWFNAGPIYGAKGRAVRDYLARRCGSAMAEAVFDNIRFDDRHTYWHGKDPAFGWPVEIHCGPAMIAPFIDLSGKVVGCHETWIDLDNGPKFRPLLRDPEDGRGLPSKKMQGAKKGALIPVCGDLSACRWVVAEGIENVAAVAGLEGFRADTFYCAAGDLGNLAGPAAGKELHPTAFMTDKRGRKRAVRVDGPIPKPDLDPREFFPVADHVDDLVLVADGDSEPLWTAFAMARAERRLSAPGRTVSTVWPPAFAGDFSELLMEAANG